MLKPIHAVLGVLALLAAGAVGLLVHVVLRDEPVRSDAASRTRPKPETVPGMPPYVAEVIGFADTPHPSIADVAIADLDADGLPDVLVCDAAANRVGWIRQSPRGVWTESFIGDRVLAPSRMAVVDLNRDGRLDVVLACRGQVEPTDDLTGRVVVIERSTEGQFATRVLLQGVWPVIDLRAIESAGGPLRGIAVATAGRDQGEIHWMELTEADGIRSERVAAGVQPVAMAGRAAAGGGLEITVLEAAERDVIRVFRRNSRGWDNGGVVWTAPQRHWAGSCVGFWNLNRSGEPDLIVGNGDRLAPYPDPQTWHGVQALSRRDGAYVAHPVGLLPGCHAVGGADLDGDGDIDFVGGSGGNQTLSPDATSIAVWMNEGGQTFRTLPLSHTPERIAAIAIGDVLGKGVPAIITGTYNPLVPAGRSSRVTLWRRP